MVVLARDLLSSNASTTPRIRRLLVLSSQLNPSYPSFRDMKDSPYYRCHVFESSGRGVAGVHPIPEHELLRFNEEERAELLHDVETIEKEWDWSSPYDKSHFTETRTTLYKLAKNDSTAERLTEENTKHNVRVDAGYFPDDIVSTNSEHDVGRHSHHDGGAETTEDKYASLPAKSKNRPWYNDKLSSSTYELLESASIEDLKMAADHYKASADAIEKKLNFARAPSPEAEKPNPQPLHPAAEAKDILNNSVVPGFFKLILPYLPKRSPGPLDALRPPTPPMEGDESAYDLARRYFLKYDQTRLPLLAVNWKFTQPVDSLATNDINDSVVIQEHTEDNGSIVAKGDGGINSSILKSQSIPASGKSSLSHQIDAFSELLMPNDLPINSSESNTESQPPILGGEDSVESLQFGNNAKIGADHTNDLTANDQSESIPPTGLDDDVSKSHNASANTMLQSGSAHGTPLLFTSENGQAERSEVESPDLATLEGVFHSHETDMKHEVNTEKPFHDTEPRKKDKSNTTTAQHVFTTQEALQINSSTSADQAAENASLSKEAKSLQQSGTALSLTPELVSVTATEDEVSHAIVHIAGILHSDPSTGIEYAALEEAHHLISANPDIITFTVPSRSDNKSTELVQISLRPAPPARSVSIITKLDSIRSTLNSLFVIYMYLAGGIPSLRLPPAWYLAVSTTLVASKYILVFVEYKFGPNSTERSSTNIASYLRISPLIKILGSTLLTGITLFFLTSPAAPVRVVQAQCTHCPNTPPHLIFGSSTAMSPANYTPSPYISVPRVFGLNMTYWLPTAICEAIHENRVGNYDAGVGVWTRWVPNKMTALTVGLGAMVVGEEIWRLKVYQGWW